MHAHGLHGRQKVDMDFTAARVHTRLAPFNLGENYDKESDLLTSEFEQLGAATYRGPRSLNASMP